MAETPDKVETFLKELSVKLRPLQEEELKLFLQIKEEEVFIMLTVRVHDIHQREEEAVELNIALTAWPLRDVALFLRCSFQSLCGEGYLVQFLWICPQLNANVPLQ